MLLRNFYLKGLHSYRRGLEQAPYGFVIPAGQGDPTARRAAGRRGCCRSASRCSARRAAFTLKEGSYPAGTYVVRLDQPYRDYAVDLLTAAGLSEGCRRGLRRRLLVAFRRTIT